MTLYKRTVRTGGGGSGPSGPQNPLYITADTYFIKDVPSGELDLIVGNALRQSWTTTPPPTGHPIGLLLALTYS